MAKLIKPAEGYIAQTQREHFAHERIIMTVESHPLLIMTNMNDWVGSFLTYIKTRRREYFWSSGLLNSGREGR